jgi:hypothetical protein
MAAGAAACVAAVVLAVAYVRHRARAANSRAARNRIVPVQGDVPKDGNPSKVGGGGMGM